MDTEPISKSCPKCHAPLPADAPQGLCPKCLLAAVATATEGGQPTGRPAPPSIEEIATAFPQLEILEFIGQGGMGFVFKARQPKLDRLVALKILPQSLAADPTFAERFNREARLLARLSHPGIVTVHDFGVALSEGRAGSPLPAASGDDSERRARTDTPYQSQPPFYYLLMEFVDGVNLRQAMQAGRFTPDQALAIVPKICEALQFAHNEGILHRDIKPENILLDAKGRVKIADFGIAKLVGIDTPRFGVPPSGGSVSPNPDRLKPGLQAPYGALTEAGKALGSPNYMAPEQIENPGEVDHRADIYSLGVVFYEMLTGELPQGRFALPSQKSAADPRVDEVVLRALEKERERRQHSAGEVRTQVETIASTPGSSRREEAQTEKSETGNRKSEMPARFSRTAIASAAWATLCFAVVPAFLWHEVKTHEFERNGPFGSALSVFVFFVFILPAFTAPFGATILGWIAVSQIRRSTGKLHGLWLAVFDGLLFPLLALDGLIYVAVGLGLWVAGLGWKRTSTPTIPLSYLLFVAVLLGILLLVDWLIIRAVWRVVNKPVGASVQPVQKPDRFWRWFAVAVFAMIAIPFLISIVGLLAAIAIPNFVKARAQVQENAQRAAAQMATNQLPDLNLSFGPVMERVVEQCGPPDFKWFDLDKGIAISAGSLSSDINSPALVDWLHKTGADVAANSGSSPDLISVGDDFVALPVQSALWDSADADKILNLARESRPAEKIAMMLSSGKFPATFVFKTREGGTGILQITGYSKNPSGVKIRYKLVQNEKTNSVSAQPKMPTSAFQIRLVADDSDTDIPTDTFTNYFDGTHLERLRLEKDILMDGTAVARAGWHAADGKTNFVIGLTEAGSQQFEALTAVSLKRRIAVVFQGRILSAPVINSRISTRSLDFAVNWDRKDLERTMNGLNQMNNPVMNLHFGPEQENVLPIIESNWAFLNLRSNRLIPTSPPDFESRAFHDWQRENGADVVATVSDVAATGDRLPALIGYGMATAPAIANGLDNNLPADIWYNWNLMVKEPESRSYLVKAPNGGQDTYYFRTSNDTWGVLQITGFTENPRGVKIRYKLVETGNN